MAINHTYEIERLQKINDFNQIWHDDYFQEYFVKRYIWDLPRASFELFGTELTYQQIDVWNEFLKSGGWRGGRLVVPAGHGVGKTAFFGRIGALHLLGFNKSITRFVAPTLAQVTNGIFKEISTALGNLKALRRINGKIYKSKWYWLFDRIQINTEKIYIKGYPKSWYIEAKTAPKGKSENLSGQHQFSYFLGIDEASGLEDEHIEALLGALSEEFNSCIMFSQHTRLQGKFHEFATIKSVDSGGVWHKIRLSSRYSPRVSRKQLETWLNTYTEDEIRVRIDGLPPKRVSGYLISQEEAELLYLNDNDIFKQKDKFRQIVFSYDLGYTGYRDSSVLSVAEVYSYLDPITQKERTYKKIEKIWKYDGTNGKMPMEFVEKIVFPKIMQYLEDKYNQGKYYERVYVVGDATAGGYEPFTKLEELLLETQAYEFVLKGLQWGTEKLYFEDKKRFVNARAKAYVTLRENLINKRLLSVTNEYRDRILRELSQIPYSFTEKYKYKIASKEEMKRKGIHSPDIVDTLAQMELLNYESDIIEDKYDHNNNTDYNEEELIAIDEDNFDNENDEIIDTEFEESELTKQKKEIEESIKTISIDDLGIV